MLRVGWGADGLALNQRQHARGGTHPQRMNMAALAKLKADGPNRDYYQRKRAEGRRHQQALIALA